jgi:energy-coupling factor transporter transmembrane protein EcfT
MIVLILVILTSGQTDDVFFLIISILKWSVVILTSIAFFVITRPFELVYALRGLKLPEGFVFAIGISFRFIPIIFEEIDKITLAQKARGLYYGKGIEKLFRLPSTIKALTIPLIVEILRKTWTVWLALNIRGYVLGKKRYNLRFKPSIINFIFISYSIGIILLSLYFR